MDVTLYFRHTNEPQNVEINEETIFDIILKNPRSSLLGLLFLFLLGFFIYNKYIDQPDTAPKEPERRHLTEHITHSQYKDFLVTKNLDFSKFVITNKFTKIQGQNDPDDENERLKEKLRQLVEHIKTLREQGRLYELKELMQVNGWMLFEILALCSKLGIDVHETLIEALGDDYCINILFVQISGTEIAQHFLVYDPNLSEEQLTSRIQEVINRAKGIFVGYARIISQERLPVLVDYDFHPDLRVRDWWDIFEATRVLFPDLRFSANRPPPPKPPDPHTAN